MVHYKSESFSECGSTECPSPETCRFIFVKLLNYKNTEINDTCYESSIA